MYFYNVTVPVPVAVRSLSFVWSWPAQPLGSRVWSPLEAWIYRAWQRNWLL